MGKDQRQKSAERKNRPQSSDKTSASGEASASLHEHSGDRPAQQWARFDALARLLTLIAFVVFAGLATWNIRLLQKQVAELQHQQERQQARRVEHAFWQITRPGTEPEHRTDAFLRLVAAGNTEWRMASLNDMRFEKTLLNAVPLKFAVFDSCAFRNVSMRKVELFGGGFSTCDLVQVNLKQADLNEAQIFRSTITETNLREATLLKASLEQSTFENSDLFSADMTEAHLLLTVFRECDLSGADLTEADLTNAKFIRTNLRLTRLPGVILNNTDFTDSNWWRARGLPPEVVNDFKQRFAPTDNAPLEFRQDYELWMKTTGSQGDVGR